MKRVWIVLAAVLCGILVWQLQHRKHLPPLPPPSFETADSNGTAQAPVTEPSISAESPVDAVNETPLKTVDASTTPSPVPTQKAAQNEPQENEPIPGSLDAWPFREAKTLQSRDTKIPGTDMFERVRTIHAQFKYPFLRVVERYVEDSNGDARITHRETMAANHILVKLQPEAGEADLEELNRAYGARILHKMVAPGMYLVALPSLDIDSVPDAVSAYNKAADQIAYSEPDMIVFAAATPNDPDFAQLYGLHNTGQSGGTADADIDAVEAWDLATGGQVVIGVIDTGVEHTHEDLAANMWINPGEIAGDGNDNDGNGFVDDVYGWDFLNGDNDPMDDNSHGTHCAGTIAGVGHNGTGVVGVNWSAKIMALKFLSAGGSGPISDAINCQAYANMMRSSGVNIRLTSNSWGGGGYSQGMADVIEAARVLDMLFIAAAGNSASDNDASPYYPATYSHDNVIAVAATDRNDNKASFSSYGLTTVDLGAPGVSTYSTVLNNGYGTKSGTSMATPHVAGVAALIWNFSPSETYQNVKDTLLIGTDPVPSMAGITVSGGRLNAHNALLALGMRIRSTTPASDDIVAAPPTDFVIEFTDPYVSSSIQASDLKVNSVPADQVTLTSSKTATFHFTNSPVVTEGLQTMQMSEGAVTRLSDGDDSGAYTAHFRWDSLILEVLSTLPADRATVTMPVTSLRLNLNEACDPATASLDDLVLSQGQVTAVNLLNSNYTVEYLLSGIQDEGALTLSLPNGALTDVHGNPAMAYDGLLHIDSTTTAYPTPFVRIEPAGSLIYDPAATAFITPPGDTDSYTFNLDGGQTVSVLVEPDSSLQATIELYDPSNNLLGSHTAPAAGAPGVLQTAFAANAGTYTVTVGGAGNSAGSYSVQVFLNVALENEEHGGAANDALQAAQPVDGSFIGTGRPGLERAAVMGSIRSSNSSPLFEENFESGSLSSAWSTYSSEPQGRIQITGAHGTADGNRALIMDRNPSGAYNLNEAIYTVDLSGLNGARLSFWHAFWYDEQQTFGGAFVDHANADGVAISDNGVSWMPIWSAAGTQPYAAWQNYEFDLAAAATAAGMQLNDQFRIKFQQYDNFPLNSDGRGWDGIVISTPNRTEDWYSFTLSANDQVSLVLADLNDGNLDLELHSSAGLMASGSSGAANVEQSIADVHIPQTATYYARVAGGGQEEYSLVITRNARFDVEPNDHSAEAIDISAAGAACGALTCPPLLFAVDWRYPPPSVILQLDPSTMDIVNQFQAPVVPHEHQSKHNLAFDGQHLWYNGGSNDTGGVTIYKLDAADGTVLGSFTPSIPVPLGLAWMNGELFAADSTKTIHVFNDTTYALERTIAPNTILAVAAFDADAKRNQLLGVTAQTLYRIDPANGNILSSSPAPREGQERGLGVVCDEIFISEFGGKIAAFDAESGAFLRRMDAPYAQYAGGLAGLNTDGPEDWYSFQAEAGASLTLSTDTPSGDPQQGMEFLNMLDPVIELYDPAMNLVGSDDNSAADGKNALLNTSASLSGTYRARVLGASGSKGEYVLSVSGTTGPGDEIPPVITCPLDETIECGDEPAGTATATDNLDPNPSIAFVDDVTGLIGCSGSGTMIRTWTATDAAGNRADCDQTITVQDTTPPALIDCPADLTVACLADVPPPGGVTATDTCDPSPAVTSSDSGSGPITRTYTATDACGNSTSCQQIISLIDDIPPIVNCPAGLTLQCSDPVPPPPAAVNATDNCDGALTADLISSVDQSDPCAGGTITHTYQAEDAAGNVGTCDYIITVMSDTAPPVITTCPGDVTVAVDANCQAVLADYTGGVAASDLCGGVTVSQSPLPGSTITGGTVVTLTVTDDCGNTSLCSLTVVPEDSEAPVITCPANTTVECGSDITPAGTGSATATDNCDSSPGITFTDTTNGSCPEVISRTWTATDTAGNTVNCEQTITVQDTAAPILSSVPASITIECDEPIPGDPGTVTADDVCDGDLTDVIVFTEGVLAQDPNCPGSGTLTHTWTVTDACGNTASATQVITVEDSTEPVLSVPADVTMECSEDRTPDGMGYATATDTCDPAPMVTFTDNSTESCSEIITRTWTATDHCGNQVTAAQTITVIPDPHLITASAGPNGAISPGGAVSVPHGSSQTFIISPNQDFQILDVVVDGTSVGAVSSYTFNSVTADHTLSASFETIYPVGDTALSDISVMGTVSGGLADSAVNDDTYQAITEDVDGLPTSLLNHEWTFDLYGAELVTFYVEAHHDANTEGDDMAFSYSTDRVTWVDMLTVTKTADDNTAQFYALPSGLSGTVYVRAVDTDRSPDHTELNTLYVDALFIVSDLPAAAPNPATTPNPPHGAADVPLAATLSWSGGAQASSRNVYFGANPNPNVNDLQGTQSGTTFAPGTLSPSTTYYWAVDEVNSLGVTPGPVWSFSTETPAPVWQELVFEDFENDWGHWVDGGSDARLSSTYAVGSQCLNLQDDSSSSYSELAANLDLSACTAIKIEFMYAAKSFEVNEDFWVQFSSDGGSTWTTIQAFVNDVDFVDDGTSYHPEILVNNGGIFTFSSTVKIRIQCDASDDKDDVFIDNIRISGMYDPAPPDAASSPLPADGATDVSVQIQLDWTPGQGSASHDVFFGNSFPPAFVGSQPGTGFDPGVLATNTTYYWSVTEVNSFGRAAGPVWSFTTGHTVAWDELNYEDFENGWGNWISGGSDAKLSSTYAIGEKCLNLQDDSSTSYAELADRLNVTGYSEMKVEFTYAVKKFSTGEDFWLRFSGDGGSIWTTVKAYVHGIDFVDDGTRYDSEIILDSATYSFTADVKFRLQCDARNDKDDVFIDNIRISAR